MAHFDRIIWLTSGLRERSPAGVSTPEGRHRPRVAPDSATKVSQIIRTFTVLTLPSNRSRSQQGATTSSRSDEVRCQRTCHPDLSASSEHHRPRFRSHAVTMMMHPAMNMIIDPVSYTH